jgi:type I restriction enzyme, S subunit
MGYCPRTRRQIITDSKEHISDLAVREVMPLPVMPGTLLFSFKLSIGKMGIAGVPLYTNEAIAALEIKLPDQLDREYLRYALKACSSEAGANHAVLGKVLNKAKVEDLPIPVIPIEEQRRIVDILSRAEAIVRLRKDAQKKAAELIPAMFLEMFGDPATNPKGWAMVRLGDLAEKMSDGPFGSNLKTSHYTEEGVRVIRLQNIGIGFLNDGDKTFVSHEHFASLPRHRCLPEDVIIATLGDPNLRAMILPPSIPEALNKADCVQFRCRRELVDPEYICWLMNMPSTLVMAASLVQGITRTRISMGRLREMFVPVPAIEIQRLFAEHVGQVRSIIYQQAYATKQTQAAFEALLAQSFENVALRRAN